MPADEVTATSALTSEVLARRLLQHLGTHGPQFRWELQEALGINDARLTIELAKLRVLKQVTFVGNPRRGRWQLPTPGPRALAPKARRRRYPRPLIERYADLFAS